MLPRLYKLLFNRHLPLEVSYRLLKLFFAATNTVSRQHLYRVHRRPENYCPRCFEVFESGVLLDEHARQLISCKVAKCPFPERLTDAQVKELKKKWNGKSIEQCWYIIFKIVFPHAPRPRSPCKGNFSSPSLYRSLMPSRCRRQNIGRRTA